MTIASDKVWVKQLNTQNAVVVLPTNEAAIAPPQAPIVSGVVVLFSKTYTLMISLTGQPLCGFIRV